MIELKKKYRIESSSSKYFEDKYGAPNPIITIENEDTKIWEGGWKCQNGNPACLSFAVRTGFSGIPIPITEKVYYGHINGLGELILGSELKKIEIRTVDEACEIPGVTKTEKGLNLHFNSIQNWYSYRIFDCPICGNTITWKWIGKMPGFTNPETTRHLVPEVSNARLLRYGHRFLGVECEDCDTNLFLENFD